MAITYYISGTDGGVSGEDFGKLLSETSGTNTNQNISLGGSPDTNVNYATTDAGAPYAIDWDGTHTLTVGFQTGVNKSYLECELVRFNSSLVEQEAIGSDGGEQETEVATNYTFVFTGTTWTSPSVTDRLAIRFTHRNANHASVTPVMYIVGTATNLVTPIVAVTTTTSTSASTTKSTSASTTQSTTASTTASTTQSTTASTSQSTTASTTASTSASTTASTSATTYATTPPSSRLLVCGFESGKGEETGSAGNATYATDDPHHGSYYLKTVAVQSALANMTFSSYKQGKHLGFTAGYSDLYIKFYFKPKVLPTTTPIPCFSIIGTSDEKLWFAIDPNGFLSAYDSNDALVNASSTDGPALSASSWYLIEIHSQSGTSGVYELKINGVSEMSGTCDQGTDNFW